MTIFVQFWIGRCSKRWWGLVLLRARMEDMHLCRLNVVLMFAHRHCCVIALFDGTVSCVSQSCNGWAPSCYCGLMASFRLSFFYSFFLLWDLSERGCRWALYVCRMQFCFWRRKSQELVEKKSKHTKAGLSRKYLERRSSLKIITFVWIIQFKRRSF